MNTYIVLGVPRGGTSMVAGLLRIMEIDMGETVDEEKHEDILFATDSVEVLRKRIVERNSKDKDWGFKNPWIGLTILRLHNNFANPHYIYISRDLVACVNSDLKHNNTFSEEGGAFSWIMNRNKELLNSISDVLKISTCPILYLSYEECLKDPVTTVKKLEDYLKIKLSKTVRDKAIAFISTGYKKIK